MKRAIIFYRFYQLIFNKYIFSDARNMARDVQKTFERIFIEVGGKTQAEAQKLQKDLERQRRYQADVWS